MLNNSHLNQPLVTIEHLFNRGWFTRPPLNRQLLNQLDPFIAAVPAGSHFWMQQVLLVLAGLAAALFGWRLLAIMLRPAPSDALCKKLDGLLTRHKVSAAEDVLRKHRAIGVRVAQEGLAACDRGAPAVSEVMAAALLLERQRLMRGIVPLQVLQMTALFFGGMGAALGMAHVLQEAALPLLNGSGQDGTALVTVAANLGASLRVLGFGIFIAWLVALATRLLGAYAQRRLVRIEILCRVILAYVKTRQQSGGWSPQ